MHPNLIPAIFPSRNLYNKNMYENELIDYLTKYNGFRKDYKNLFPNKEETIRLLLKITLPNDLEPSFLWNRNMYIQL